MKTKYVLIVTGVILLGLMIYQLASNKKQLNQNKNPEPMAAIRIPVKVVAATEKDMEIVIKKTGNLAPFKEVKALAITGGTIRQVKFEIGDFVSQGQILATTDSRLLQLEVEKAETSARKLKSDLDTYTELLAGKAATQEKVNTVRQDYLDAVNLVNQAKKNLGDAIIKAPISGTISTKTVEEGLFVSPGTELATIINLSQSKVRVNLTETEVYQVSQGQSVKITTDVYPGKSFDGTISFISPQSDATNNYPLEIMIKNAGQSVLRSGTFVYADFSKKTNERVLVIPREALTQSIKDASVFVVSGNAVKLKPIKTGAEFGNLIQVLSGLNVGEVVVTSGQINLKEGTQVSVSK
jgi:membrane fusion protein (multidrug efflux system)